VPALVAVSCLGCSIRSMAVGGLADSLAGSGAVYASDDDPELVRDALPFALKTHETLLAEAPEHAGLLTATCRGFTQYSAGFVEGDALYAEAVDWMEAERLRRRALGLYLRARDYCLRGLELARPGIGTALRLEPEGAVEGLEEESLELIFWTGASWGAAIASGLDRPDLVVDLPAVQALMARALELDEAWDDGAIHTIMISLEALPEAMGGSPERARRHFERAVELSGGRQAAPYLRLASGRSVAEADREEIVRLLEAALAIDPDDAPGSRLANLLAQRRARFLLEHVDDYFLPEEPAPAVDDEGGVE
jgi:predicted anti-sigma-YlaC factor YlaD